MTFKKDQSSRAGTTRLTMSVRLSLPLLGALAMLGGCESTDKKKDDPAGNVLLKDENNYQSMSKLTIPNVEVTPGVDIDICWTGVVTDLQRHSLNPLTDVDNVGFLRFLHLDKAAVTKKLTAGQVKQSDVSGYLEYNTDHVSTCMKLSQFAFFETRINVKEQFVETTDQTYMLLFSEGTDPGIGARSMIFVTPSAASTNLKVEARPGGEILDFSADLVSAAKVPVPIDGPWTVDWRALTLDGQKNPVMFESIDGVMIGFYEGMTVTELQTKILDLELLATSLWELPLETSTRTADLSAAKERTAGTLFPGFGGGQVGVWVLGLMCSACQNPAPVLLTVLDPGAVTP